MPTPAPVPHGTHPTGLSLTRLAFAVACLATAPAHAADKTWLCSNSYWDIAGCWSGGTLPGPQDSVFVTPVGGGLTRLRMDALSGQQAAARLELNGTGSAPVSLELIGGTLSISGLLTVGRNGVASVDHAQGVVNAGQLRLANDSGASGFYQLGYFSELNAGSTLVGTAGEGTFLQVGGVHRTGSLFLAHSPETPDLRAVGHYTMNGGTLTVNGDFATISGTGYFTQTAGTTQVLFGLTMASGASSRGQYLLSGGSLALNGGLFSGDGEGEFVQTGGTHTINGTVLLRAGGRYEMNGGTLTAPQLQLAGGSFTMNGGSFSTSSIGGDPTQGAFRLNGGNLSFTGAVSVGSFEIGSGVSFVHAAGRTFTVTSLVNAGSFAQQGMLTLLGASRNEGSWSWAGAAIATQGTLSNAGLLSGHGRIQGDGAFVNFGMVQHSGGTLELATTGANLNSGNWDLQPNAALRLTGAVLSNQGALTLNGGAVTGTGTLNNAVGGTVSGRGSITTAFSNAGRVVVTGGNLGIAQAFANSGSLVLTDASAMLSGGAITNSGRIEGQGQVGNAVANTGSVEARGGSLWINGSLTNGGRLRSASGSELVVGAGLASNAGTIELAGGSFDNNGFALGNAASGRITGFGTLRAGSIANRGQLQLSGGTSDIHGSFVGLGGSATVLSGLSNTTFHDAAVFEAGSELRVSAGSVATFFGAVQQRSGASFTGTGSKFFEGGFSIGDSPGAGSDAGSVIFGGGNLYLAEIGGSAPGTGFDRYSVAGTLTFGGTLTLVSWAGFVGQTGQSFDLFDWGSLSGSFDRIDASGLLLADGAVLDTSRLYTDGVISVSAVPEPATWMAWIAGLALLGLRGCRRRPV